MPFLLPSPGDVGFDFDCVLSPAHRFGNITIAKCSTTLMREDKENSSKHNTHPSVMKIIYFY